MIDYQDEVPQGEILYHITETVDAQGNKAYRIELATEVIPGTPMNKVLFDSIKTDLTNLENNKLNTSLKASQSEAQSGTNNTKYMTPLRTEQHFTSKKATQAEAEAGTDNTTFMTPLTSKQQIVKNYLPSKQMSIKTGSVSDGEMIPKTAGYSNYKYFVSPTMDNYVELSDSNEIFGAGYKIECDVNQTTRVVTAKAWIKIQKANTSSQLYRAITANYIEIAWN